MSEMVNYPSEDSRNSFVAFLLVEAISAHPDRELQKEIIASGEGSNYELTLTVNGYELPVRPVLEHMEAQYDEQVRKKAEEIIREKFSDLEDILYEAKGGLKQLLARLDYE